jgi:predicted nucleotidyltransferase
MTAALASGGLQRADAGEKQSDPFRQLGISAAAASILRYFLVRPGVRSHTREIQRALNLGGASIQRELERLVRCGALLRSALGRRVYYSPSDDVQLWTAFRLLAARVSDPTYFIRDALADLPGVTAAFVFGSFASGTDAVESDLDLLLVEDSSLDARRLLSRLAEVQLLLGREINLVRYTQQQLAERLGDAEHPASRFVRSVLAGPKRWLAGGPEAIAHLALAAGLRLNQLGGAAQK